MSTALKDLDEHRAGEANDVEPRVGTGKYHANGEGRPPVLRALIDSSPSRGSSRDGGQPQGSPEERQRAGVSDSTRSNLMVLFREDFAGSITGPDTAFTVAQMFEWWEENGMIGGDAVSGNANKPLVAAIKMLEWIWLSPTRNRIFSTLYAANLPLFDDIIGHRTMAQFARELGYSKEAVRKEVELAQKRFGWAPRPEQRGEGAKKKMSEKRISQLRK